MPLLLIERRPCGHPRSTRTGLRKLPSVPPRASASGSRSPVASASSHLCCPSPHIESAVLGNWPKPQKHNPAHGMIAVDWVEKGRLAVERQLRSEGNTQVWYVADFMVIAQSVCLNASRKMFFKAWRLETFAENQFVAAIHIFDSCPQVLPAEAKRRFRQIAIEDLLMSQILIAPPDKSGRPVAIRERSVVRNRSRHAAHIFFGVERFGTGQMAKRILHAPVLCWIN